MDEDALGFLAGGGELGARIREHNWAATPLGPARDWAPGQKANVALVLGSEQPLLIGWGPELNLIYNAACVPLLGDLHPSVLGRPAPLVWAALWPRMAAELAPILSDGQSFRREALPVVISRQGTSETLHLTLACSAIRDGAGRISGVLCACTDETSHVRARAALEEERKRLTVLDELNRAKTSFLSSISHEFRTPLTSVLGPVDALLAQASAGLPPAAADQLALVQRGGMRLLKLVNTLHDFARVEAGRVQALYEPTDLAAFTQELASVFRAAIERADMRLIVACPPLPQPVYVDRDMWEKIVLNLISNAFRFTRVGEITVHLSAADDAAVLSVRDTGVGISSDELPRVFERFHSGKDSRGRSYEGTGIGLSLVQELVKLHGGRVQVESELGHGACFRVWIPLGTRHLDPQRIAAPLEPAAVSGGAEGWAQEAQRWLDGATGRGRALRSTSDELPYGVPPPAQDTPRARVVWADDDADMRMYVSRLLHGRFDVIAVADGRAALAAVREHQPDVVLADIMMPRLDGIGLLRALRADPKLREIPVILLSARAGDESRIDGLSEGADDYLIKPFSARELVARVDTHARLARLRREARESIRSSEAKLKRMVNVPGVAVLLFELASGVLLEANDTFMSMFGYTHEDLASRQVTWHTLIPAEHITGNERALEQLQMTGRIGPYEREYRRRDGTRSWLVLAGAALGDGTMVEYCMDVSERRRAEAALRDSEERFRALATATSYAVYRMTPDCSQLRRFDERGPIAALPESTPDWITAQVAPDDHAAVSGAFEAAVRSQAPFTLEYRTRLAGGEHGWTSLRAVPIFNPEGELLEWVTAASDVSSRKQAEQALRDSEAQLKIANQAKDEFLATLGH
ncbi:MAG: ATP-binding protein, partial [Polyangiales bacterium]